MDDRPVVFDASAYRALARDGDALRAAASMRDLGRALADAERGRAFASPFALWALLADVAAAVPSQDGRGKSKRAPTDAEHARAARARLGLAACAAHCAAPKVAPGAHGFALAVDADTAACLALGLQPPAEVIAWSEYLASVASEIAAEPTAERAQRLAGPLAHVAERARSAIQDFSDEMQDGVLAAYDNASIGWHWDDDTDDETRQRALTGPLGAVPDDDVGAIGEPLILGVLRRDPLLRAIAAGRVTRAHAVIARASGAARDMDDVADSAPPSLDETARIAERFVPGVALGREVLRRVIAGDLEVAERSARRWLWDLHVAYGLAAERGVTGNGDLGDALRAGVQGIDPLPAYRARHAL